MTNRNRTLAVLASMVLSTGAAAADADSRLVIAVGTPGSESFTFGTELWAMGQMTLLPTHGIQIDAKEVEADADRLTLLQNRDVQAALVYGNVPEAYSQDMGAVMALWPEGIVSDESDPVQLLVHKDVADDVVYRLTEALFDHAGFFKNAHAQLGVGRPSEAMSGLDLPFHAGASRYYQEEGFGLSLADADYWRDHEVSAEGRAVRSSAVTYRNFDDGHLEDSEIEQIIAACRQALEDGSLSVVLGDLSNTGCEVYQQALVQPAAGGEDQEPVTDAAAAPVQAAQSGSSPNPQLGQGGPAIRWKPVGETDLKLNTKPAKRVRQPVM